jgi:AspT/YidE/YbjL antiporter-like protein
MMSVLKDFGLILFVYTVGLQVGPSFFVGLKEGGLKLNLQAIAIVVLGAIITILISIFGGESLDMMAGVYSGSISSTPGLSAAQEAVTNLGRGNIDAITAGYAITYPVGVIVPIICCIVIRRICNVHLDEETLLVTPSNKEEKISNTSCKENVTFKTVIVLFSGILFGLIIGSISVNIPVKGVIVPIKLGNTGGALVMAILMSYIGNKRGWIDSSVTHSESVTLLREIGIVVFLALVGLTASRAFFEINLKDGAKWMMYGLLISVIPTLMVGIFVRMKHKTNYFTLIGMIGGATTDTPALAYASKMAANHADGIPAAAYATVYPLTVFLRILTAQLFVIIMV